MYVIGTALGRSCSGGGASNIYRMHPRHPEGSSAKVPSAELANALHERLHGRVPKDIDEPISSCAKASTFLGQRLSKAFMLSDLRDHQPQIYNELRVLSKGAISSLSRGYKHSRGSPKCQTITESQFNHPARYVGIT